MQGVQDQGVPEQKICNKGEVARTVKWDKKKREALGYEQEEDLALWMSISPLFKDWILENIEKMQQEVWD